MKKTVVISAVNIVSGGTLTILDSMLKSASEFAVSHSQCRFIAYVHRKDMFSYPNIEYVEVPQAKKNWFRRVYVEYVYFRRVSQRLKPDVWLSMHDMTPNVVAGIRAVYCHNSTPFYKLRLRDLKFDYKLILFSLFYKFLYRINIKKNDFVIVQQNWLRDSFVKMYGLSREKVVVAYPERVMLNKVHSMESELSGVCQFLYPSLARQFKNFEVICQAVEILEKDGVNNFKVTLTIDGSENSYARWVCEKYKHLKCVDFIGLIPYSKMADVYSRTNCLIFPSRLETWGLPISEFSIYGRPIIASDLPYAKETASGADKVRFFDPSSANQLALIMRNVINGDLSEFSPVPMLPNQEPTTDTWMNLCRLITGIKN